MKSECLCNNLITCLKVDYDFIGANLSGRVNLGGILYHQQLYIWKITIHTFKDTLPEAEVSYTLFILILVPHAHLTGSSPVRSRLNLV